MSPAKCSFRLGLSVLTLFYPYGDVLAPYVVPVPYIYWTYNHHLVSRCQYTLRCYEKTILNIFS